MDTSETYIKMCEKAKEIQSLRDNDEDLLVGDYVQNREFYSPFFICLIVRPDTKFELKRPWLPRQDQLQEMLLREIYEEKYDLSSAFACYLHDKADISTFEQLWLAFVMHEKYNKTWNGEDWIAEVK